MLLVCYMTLASWPGPKTACASRGGPVVSVISKTRAKSHQKPFSNKTGYRIALLRQTQQG